MPRGLKDILDDLRKRTFQRSDVYLAIQDKEAARIRILDEADLIESAYFHRVPRRTPSGKTFTDEVICLEDDTCEYCMSNDPALQGLKTRLFVNVWVFEIRKPSGQTIVDASSYDTEQIGATKILRFGVGWQNYLVTMFANFYTLNGTLCDRDFWWVRTGARLDTTFQLVPLEPSQTPAEVTEAKSQVKPIVEYVESLREAVRSKPQAQPQEEAPKERREPSGTPLPAGILEMIRKTEE